MTKAKTNKIPKHIGNIYTSQDRDIIIMESVVDSRFQDVKYITFEKNSNCYNFNVIRFERSYQEIVFFDNALYAIHKVKNKSLFLTRLQEAKNNTIELEGVVKETKEKEELLEKYINNYFYLVTKVYAEQKRIEN